jgi:hypothetical protein
MPDTQFGRWRLVLRTGLVFLAGGIFTACCPQGPKPPQPATGCPQGKPPSTATELEACLQGSAFDSAYEASDEQPLTVITHGQGPACPGDSTGGLTCRYGPIAKIEPLIGAQRYSEEELRQGRFIARMTITSGKEGYAKYGLQPGAVTYWWVQTNAAGTGGVSHYITITKDRKVSSVQRKLVRELYRRNGDSYGGKIRRAVTRWLWTLEDETGKGTCGAGKC